MVLMSKIKSRRNKKKSGFSLLEVLVAMGVLLVGIVPIITLGTQAILFHYRAAEGEEAARMSKTIVDYIRSRGYDNLGNFTSVSPYTLVKTSTGGFTSGDFASDFGIDSSMVLFDSKGLDLYQVSFYVDIKETKGVLKDSNENIDSYEDPITGEMVSDVYQTPIIYGKVIFGFGNEDNPTKSSRKKELVTTFIMTPIENWK